MPSNLISVSTLNAGNFTFVISGAGVATREVYLGFGEASEFLEYDAAATLTVDFTLPFSDNPPATTVNRKRATAHQYFRRLV